MFLTVVSVVLLLATVVSGFVTLHGQDRWKRLLGYLLVAGKVNMLIVIFALVTGNGFSLDIALVYILLSYVGVLALCDYMVRKEVRSAD